MKITHKIYLLLAFFMMNVAAMPLSAQDTPQTDKSKQEKSNIDKSKQDWSNDKSKQDHTKQDWSKGDKSMLSIHMLPVSTNSEEAKQAFAMALDRIWNADMKGYQKKMEAALNADPNFFMAHANRALIESSDDDNKEADKHLEKALAISQDGFTPAESIIRKMLVAVKDDKQSDLKSIKEELIETYPDNIMSYGIAYNIERYNLDNTDEAYKYIRKMVALEPRFGPAWNQLGYYHLDRNNMDSAYIAFKNYTDYAPNEPNAHDSMGDYYMEAKDYQHASEHFDKAVAMGMDVSQEKAERAKSLAAGEDVIPEED
jgi:tetratricopeptide (TPR) repeat protein